MWITSFIGFWLRLRPWTWSPEKEKEMAVLEKLKKKKKNRKKKKKIFIYHNNRYYMHLFPGMIQDPSRAVLAPCRPLPLRGKWSVRTQGGLGWWGVCAVPWMDLIVSISQHYVYIYINVNSFIRIIGTRWCRPPFSYRTPVPVLITWEESGASALLELGAGPAAIWDMAQGISLPLIIHLRT